MPTASTTSSSVRRTSCWLHNEAGGFCPELCCQRHRPPLLQRRPMGRMICLTAHGAEGSLSLSRGRATAARFRQQPLHGGSLFGKQGCFTGIATLAKFLALAISRRACVWANGAGESQAAVRLCGSPGETVRKTLSERSAIHDRLGCCHVYCVKLMYCICNLGVRDDVNSKR